MNITTQGECLAILLEHLRQGQSACATMAHLIRSNGTGPCDTALANGWLVMSENMKRQVHIVTKMAQGKLQ